MTSQVIYLTTNEVAQFARVDASTVRRWVERGELKPAMTLPGGHYRFAQADVHKALGVSAEGAA
ncbi:helix-turn-helix domain-containing protein [Microcella frigidaquae]|uniref:helix-turn-helix domain-containing protein n=1 Tax=Microcella frigidaquae TaxID=424758 RepID=UPI00129E4BB5|nr:helix-turn-helix domain-containing protein [Microcella frigidaquae]NHN45054.1 helix-turn-helix domain-containing protein [Microcella frigidaquae]